MKALNLTKDTIQPRTRINLVNRKSSAQGSKSAPNKRKMLVNTVPHCKTVEKHASNFDFVGIAG